MKKLGILLVFVIAGQLHAQKLFTLGIHAGVNVSTLSTNIPDYFSLKKAGYNVERKTLHIADDGIKTIGTYKATAQLHKEVKVEFNFNVVAE